MDQEQGQCYEAVCRQAYLHAQCTRDRAMPSPGSTAVCACGGS
jgi:hypothetical protein